MGTMTTRVQDDVIVIANTHDDYHAFGVLYHSDGCVTTASINSEHYPDYYPVRAIAKPQSGDNCYYHMGTHERDYYSGGNCAPLLDILTMASLPPVQF